MDTTKNLAPTTQDNLRSPAVLPMRSGDAAPQSTAWRTPAHGGTTQLAARRAVRVLLVDDSEVIRNGLAHLLQLQPDIHVVGKAADGIQAVQMALSLRPDVVVMDVSMPHLDGVYVTRCLTRQLLGVRVIGLSMHTPQEMADSMTAAGAVAYLTKTMPPEALVAKIRECAAAPSC